MKLSRQATEMLKQGGIRPSLLAQSATIVADIFFAGKQLDDAEAMVQLATQVGWVSSAPVG